MLNGIRAQHEGRNVQLAKAKAEYEEELTKLQEGLLLSKGETETQILKVRNLEMQIMQFQVCQDKLEEKEKQLVSMLSHVVQMFRVRKEQDEVAKEELISIFGTIGTNKTGIEPVDKTGNAGITDHNETDIEMVDAEKTGITADTTDSATGIDDAEKTGITADITVSATGIDDVNKNGITADTTGSATTADTTVSATGIDDVNKTGITADTTHSATGIDDANKTAKKTGTDLVTKDADKLYHKIKEQDLLITNLRAEITELKSSPSELYEVVQIYKRNAHNVRTILLQRGKKFAFEDAPDSGLCDLLNMYLDKYDLKCNEVIFELSQKLKGNSKQTSRSVKRSSRSQDKSEKTANKRQDVGDSADAPTSPPLKRNLTFSTCEKCGKTLHKEDLPTCICCVRCEKEFVHASCEDTNTLLYYCTRCKSLKLKGDFRGIKMVEDRDHIFEGMKKDDRIEVERKFHRDWPVAFSKDTGAKTKRYSEETSQKMKDSLYMLLKWETNLVTIESFGLCFRFYPFLLFLCRV
jgi:hypothetical protein